MNDLADQNFGKQSISYCHTYLLRLVKLLKGGVHGDILLKINLFIYPNKYLYFFYDKKSFPGFKGDNKGLNRYTGNT